MTIQNQDEQQPQDILDLVAQKLNQSFRRQDGQRITYQQARVERVISDALNGKAYANKQLADWEKQKRERDAKREQAKEQGKTGTVKEMLADCLEELTANVNATQESSDILTVAHFLNGAKEALAQACIPVQQQEEILSALCAKHHLRPILPAMYNFAHEHFHNALRTPTALIRNLQFVLDGQKPLCDVWFSCGNIGELSPIFLPYLSEGFYTTSVKKSFEGPAQERFQEALQSVSGHGQASSSIASQIHKIEDESPTPDNNLANPSEVACLTPEQAQFMDQVKQLGTAPVHTAQKAEVLYKKLFALTKSPIYSTLSQSDRWQVRFTLSTLKTQKEQHEEKEVHKLQDAGYEHASAGLGADYYPDPAAQLRPAPFDAAKIPLQNDEIWNQRFTIAKEHDKTKAARLVAEFDNRSLEELQAFLGTYNRRTIEAWEEVYILQYLRKKVNNVS